MENQMKNEMNQEEIMRRLQEPFDPKHIEWRVKSTVKTRNGSWKALVLAYVTNRAIMDRLDSVFGFGNWQNEFIQWGDKGVLCRLKVKVNGEWIVKEDGSEETQYESVKGGFSASMKRAAVQLGIARYLYDLGEVWVDLKDKGENYVKVQENGQNKALYWDNPKLPDWALPKTSQRPVQKGQQSNQPNVPQQTFGKNAEVEAKKALLQEIAKNEKIIGLSENKGYILPLFRKANGNVVGEHIKLTEDIAKYATLKQLNNYYKVIKPVAGLLVVAQSGNIEVGRVLELASILFKEEITSVMGLFFRVTDSSINQLVGMLKQDIRNRNQKVS